MYIYGKFFHSAYEIHTLLSNINNDATLYVHQLSFHIRIDCVCKDQHHLNNNNHAGKMETNNISRILYSIEVIRHIYFSRII